MCNAFLIRINGVGHSYSGLRSSILMLSIEVSWVSGYKMRILCPLYLLIPIVFPLHPHGVPARDTAAATHKHRRHKDSHRRGKFCRQKEERDVQRDTNTRDRAQQHLDNEFAINGFQRSCSNAGSGHVVVLWVGVIEKTDHHRVRIDQLFETMYRLRRRE